MPPGHNGKNLSEVAFPLKKQPQIIIPNQIFFRQSVKNWMVFSALKKYLVEGDNVWKIWSRNGFLVVVSVLNWKKSCQTKKGNICWPIWKVWKFKLCRSSPSVCIFFPISEFSYFVIKFLYVSDFFSLRLHMEFGSVVTDLAGSFVPIFGC